MWLPTLLALTAAVSPAVHAPAAPATQQTWYVDASVAAVGDGSSATPFFSVTFALNQPQVVSGDLILVAPGEYVEEEINFGGKNVTVESEAGPDVTRLVARTPFFPTDVHPVVRMENGETQAVLKGFELTSGTGSLECTGFTQIVGGAVVVCGASGLFEDCVFTSNSAERGGAVYAADARLTLTDCLFRGPGSDAQGEAVYALRSALVATDCSFEDLRIGPQSLPVGQSAVIVDQSTALFEDCTFTRNATRLFGAHLWSRSSDVTVEDSLFSVATGYAGASVVALGGTLRLQDSIIELGLSVSTPGAGVFASGALVVANGCIFRDNHCEGGGEGGAISVQASQLQINNSTFVRNQADLGGAIHMGLLSTANVRDSLFADNSAIRGGGAIVALDGSVDVERSIFLENFVLGTAPGTGPGGAILGDSSLIRCTLIENAAQTGGGVAGSATVIGSIIWNNQPTDLDPSCTAFNSIVRDAGGAATTDTRDLDPRFFGPGDLHLLPGSPAIDALPAELLTDPDGSRGEIGAVTYDPFHCGTPCDGFMGEVQCTPAANSAQQIGQLIALGTNELDLDRLLVTASALPPNSIGMLVVSSGGGSIPLPGGASPLCLSAPLFRMESTIGVARPDGTLGMRLPLLSGPIGNMTSPGQSWHLQTWYRDARPDGTTSNTTEAIRITLR